MSTKPAENPANDQGRTQQRGWIRRIGTALSDIILPPACLLCRSPVDTHATLCPPCWTGIDFITPPICDRLGIPLPYDPGGTIISAGALANPPDYNRARAVAAYTGAMRQLVHGYKYKDRLELLLLFSRWLNRAGHDILADADMLIPVPLYWSRLWSRRFNQAAKLADILSAQTGLARDHMVLQRTRRTRSQIGMTAAQRKRNVAGAFRIRPSRRHLISGSRVVLVDDVITTGATVNACARTLRASGAARIDVLALARTTGASIATI